MKAPYDIFDYPSYWEGRDYENEADKLAISKLVKKIEKKESLIDIAGGFGRLSSFLAPYFENILLVDHSEALLKEAEKYLSGLGNIKLKKGNCEKLSVEAGGFDCALMVRIIHHFENPEKALREAHKALKPGGYLILEFANKIHFLAWLKAFLRGNFSFCQSLKPAERRSEQAIKEEMITFCNHHPKAIQNSLEKIGFRVVDKLSVSNYRFPIFKKIFPLPLLLFCENLTQRPLAKLFFGPSVYFLAQKS